jgi:hypothetical protein
MMFLGSDRVYYLSFTNIQTLIGNYLQKYLRGQAERAWVWIDRVS